MQQVRTGDAHLTQSAVAVSFSELESGVEKTDLVHFAQINDCDGFFLARRGRADGDFSLKDLEGTTALVDHFFQPLAMLKYACHKHGVNYAAIKVEDHGPPDAMESAFREGKGDFVHLQGPVPQQLEHDGLATTVASIGKAVGPVAFSSLCAKRSWLESDMATAFMRAYRKGRKATAELPARQVAGVLQPFFPEIKSDVLIATVAAYQAMGTWGGEVAIPRGSYETLVDIFLHCGVITRRHPYEAAIQNME